MPDGPRYDDDFYAWTKYQAKVLRDARVEDNRFDRENLVDGDRGRVGGRSNATRFEATCGASSEHFLKLAHSPATQPRHGWRRSIVEARAQLGDKSPPSLRRSLHARLPLLYDEAREIADEALREFGEDAAAERLPPACPYTLAQIIERGWYPEPPK